jgi:hypothetical protein
MLRDNRKEIEAFGMSRGDMSNENKYGTIINHPHHVSERHPPLSRASYAAQFSPFAALTGYDSIVSETARITDEKPDLDEDAKELLSRKLTVVLNHIADKPAITVTYFLPDRKKDGGKLVTVKGTVRRYDELEKIIHMEDGAKIPVNSLMEISGEIIEASLPEEV